MDLQCYPITAVPGTSALLRDFLDPADAHEPTLLRSWYPGDPFALDWAQRPDAPALDASHRNLLADLLTGQAADFAAGPAARANIEQLRGGAAAVVTGQQVALFGGPLLVLLKAATAIRKAQDASAQTGRPHVPVFWLATEDHDLAEVSHVSFPAKSSLETVDLGLTAPRPVPVGGLHIESVIEAPLDRASELIGWGPIADLLRSCYAPEQGTTLAQAFGRLLSAVFAEFGLIVMDASSRGFHQLGAPVLRGAIENAAHLEELLLARSAQIVRAGYHAQVLVTPGHSLLFLLDAETGARLPLRRTADGEWKSGARSYTTADLLAILDTEPERLSPNALLRPVFQDAILPTAAYIGGPAEIAYFAQSAVVYQELLGRVTPILPRLSATLIEPALAAVMERHEVDLPQLWEAKTVDALAQRLGARAMPIDLKRKLAAAGNALDQELEALAAHMSAMSPDLGRAAGVSASKMRYQMNRLRRMAATFELQRQSSLRKHATALMLNLYPDGHLQERVIGGAWFLARYADALPGLLVDNATQQCPGHRILTL
jgi:bacillithiol biosynthesis cysteine-adding enzyme BshC